MLEIGRSQKVTNERSAIRLDPSPFGFQTCFDDKLKNKYRDNNNVCWGRGFFRITLPLVAREALGSVGVATGAAMRPFGLFASWDK